MLRSFVASAAASTATPGSLLSSRSTRLVSRHADVMKVAAATAVRARSSMPAEATGLSTRREPYQTASMLDIGSRRIFNEELDAFREMARRYFNERVQPFHEEWENAGSLSREAWQEAGAAGLLGVATPEAYGGQGDSILGAAIVWEEQQYVNASGPGWALHSDIVMPYIVNYGTEEQKQRWLPAMASGDLIGAIAMTEPGAGSDLQGVKTTAGEFCG